MEKFIAYIMGAGILCLTLLFAWLFIIGLCVLGDFVGA